MDRRGAPSRPHRGAALSTGRAPIALTPGDPEGIGAEVGVAAILASMGEPRREILLLGREALWARAAALRGSSLAALRDAGCRLVPADPQADPRYAGIPEIEAIATAVRLCQVGEASALCTLPIHKESLLRRGFPHPGHTPYLADLCDRPPREAVMLFAGGSLRVALATVHVPLAQVAERLCEDDILLAARASCELLRRGLGVERPRVAVCGLNPHAGEGGMIGEEELRVIAPAVARLRAEGIDASGPHPADTIFAQAVAGRYDLVLAMYHDQGLIPVKTVDFGRSVNITAGLPILRTSVDHGTARDIAWRGIADERHAVAALKMAARLADGAGS